MWGPRLRQIADAAGISLASNLEDSFLARKDYPDGRMAVVVMMTFGKGRITIGPADKGWYDEAW
jgi:hypothetical protein